MKKKSKYVCRKRPQQVWSNKENQENYCIALEKSKKSLNEEGGFLFWGGWNISKSVSVGSTFIREMRVHTVWFLWVPMDLECSTSIANDCQ